jgi:hypothetical protein
MAEVFRGLSKFLQAYAGVVPQSWQSKLPFQFIYRLIILLYYITLLY